MNEIRLNKVLAAAGVCSRRKADELIRSGAVRVNGQIISELGIRIDPATATVLVHDKHVPLMCETSGQEHTYILLHKPIQVVSTAKDPEGRPTVLDLLPAELRAKRLYPVGRLDYFSEGLILLTDDGELTNRLTHPRYHMEKVYEVHVREIPSQSLMQTMKKGMVLREGERLAPVKVEFLPEHQILLMTLRQGINRQIRRMCRDLGLTILRLCRVRFGPVDLGGLEKGRCRSLTSNELAALKKAVGLS